MSEAKRLKTLEDENTLLKRLLADSLSRVDCCCSQAIMISAQRGGRRALPRQRTGAQPGCADRRVMRPEFDGSAVQATPGCMGWRPRRDPMAAGFRPWNRKQKTEVAAKPAPAAA